MIWKLISHKEHASREVLRLQRKMLFHGHLYLECHDSTKEKRYSFCLNWYLKIIKNCFTFLKFLNLALFLKIWHNCGLLFQMPPKFHKCKEFSKWNIPINLIQYFKWHFPVYTAICSPDDDQTPYIKMWPSFVLG